MKYLSSCKNPIRVGSVVIRPGIPTEISKKEIDGFCKSRIGQSLFDMFLKGESKDIGEDLQADDKEELVINNDESFSFNPFRHKIVHRGGGSWFVMEGNSKRYGPLTPEEKITFEALINDG